MRATFAIGGLVVAGLLLALVSVRTESANGTTAAGRILPGAVIGLIAATTTISIWLDVIPDDIEAELLDVATIMLAALVAIVLVARRLW